MTGLIFTGCYDSFKPMSENTINKALRNMGYDTKQDILWTRFFVSGL